MSLLKIINDRKIDSTENNDFAEGYQDENLWEQDQTDTEISLDNILTDEFETPEDNGPVYNESGYENLHQ